MDQNEDPRELELKIEQVERIAARISDPATYERLKAWADELRVRLRRHLDRGHNEGCGAVQPIAAGASTGLLCGLGLDGGSNIRRSPNRSIRPALQFRLPFS